MAQEAKWPDGGRKADGGGGGGERPTDAGLPPPFPPDARPLDYVRPGYAGDRDEGLPVGVGFVIGVVLYVAVAGAWWVVASQAGHLSLALLGLAGVPVAAAVLGGILQASLGWRGVVAGVGAAVGLSLLLGCFGIMAICGAFRV